MSWLKKIFSVEHIPSAKEQKQQNHLQQQKLSEQELQNAAILREAQRQKALLRAFSPFRSVLELLDERYISDAINAQKLVTVLATPGKEFPKDIDTLKVLPAPESNVADMERFWNSMRTIAEPIAFDLVSNPDTMHFQMTCQENSGLFIEQQLAIHFSGASCIFNEREFSKPDTNCVTFYPKDASQFFDSTNVARDMYTQLFPLLDDPGITSEVTVQVICRPIYHEAITALGALLDWEEPGIPLSKINPGLQTMPHPTLEIYYSLLSERSLEHLEISRGDTEQWYGPQHERVAQWPHDKLGDLINRQSKQNPYISHRYLQRIVDGLYPNYRYYEGFLQCIESEISKAERLAKESREMKKRLENKIPAYAACINIYSPQPQVIDLIQQRYLRQFETPTQRWQIEPDEFERDPTERPINNWSVVSASELASFAHFPTKGVTSPRLEQASMKAIQPPALYTDGAVQIGVSAARGQQKPISLPDSIRSRHLYVVGKSGSGKSTLITNIARQDIERGDGVCVIDPHGDLVSDLLDCIPEGRINDTIYFNVSDRAHPIGLDMLSAKSEAEIELLTDDLITTFRRLTDTWGERMETILRYSFNTLLRTPGATFLDLQKLLINESWRSNVVRKLDYPPLADFWSTQFPNMPKDATQPILSRMTKIVLSPTLNNIFGQSQNTLNFNEVIRNKKILLINLGADSRDPDNPQLAVSDETKKLVGSVIVSQLQLAAMRQANLPEHQRIPCRFFVDEFQNFVSGAFPKILSEARKFKLCLTVAHQYISQLDDATRNAVFGNVGTMVVMPLGQKDAAYLGAELGTYTPEDVANLSPERHEALCRPTTMAQDTFLFTTLAPSPRPQSYASEIIERTHERYTRTHTPVSAPVLPAQEQPDAAPLLSVPEATAATLHLIPARTPQQNGISREEKISAYLRAAGYLSNQQLIDLAFTDLSTLASKKKTASIVLARLEEERAIASLNFEGRKICYVGKKPNVRTHDLAVRDVLVSIWQEGLDIASVQLFSEFDQIGKFNPDLAVTFLSDEGEPIQTLWEIDMGTENDSVLLDKINRYRPFFQSHKIVFVFSDANRIKKLSQKIATPLPILATSLEMREGEQGGGAQTGGMSGREFVLLHSPERVVPLFGGAASASPM